MKEYNNIQLEYNEFALTVWLNRPERHNALNPDLMQELIDLVKALDDDQSVRVLVLRGLGKSFCAGADLEWMKRSAKLNAEQNLADSELLYAFFTSIYHCKKVVIGIGHGNVFGGGNGLLAVCDIAYAIDDTRFALSEAKLGLIAASITPFMLRKLQASVYKELIFTAKVFNGKDAEAMGLINKSFVNAESLEEYLSETIDQIGKAGPESLMGSKQLINDLSDLEKNPEILKKIPQILANVRVGKEAQEGFNAFLEKRKPNW